MLHTHMLLCVYVCVHVPFPSGRGERRAHTHGTAQTHTHTHTHTATRPTPIPMCTHNNHTHIWTRIMAASAKGLKALRAATLLLFILPGGFAAEDNLLEPASARGPFVGPVGLCVMFACGCV